MLRVTVKEYIAKLKATEAKLVESDPSYTPRHIPNTRQLADHSAGSVAHYYKWAGNRTAHISRIITAKVVEYLRSLGFNTTLNDILKLDV